MSPSRLSKEAMSSLVTEDITVAHLSDLSA